MKHQPIIQILSVLFLLVFNNLFGQTAQLEVTTSTNETAAISAESDFGIEIRVESLNDFALHAKSTTGPGVYGSSTFSYGGFFINTQKDNPDLVIGGNLTNANGVLSSDPLFPGSSLFIRSNNSLLLQLDHNNDSEGFFTIQNGSGTAVLSVGELGDMALAGNSEAARPHLLLRETETNDFARLRLFNDSNGNYWDVAGGGFLNGELNFYHSQIGNILQLHTIGNPITTSTGAYLSVSGVWTDAPAAQLRQKTSSIDPETLLKNIQELPLYHWKSKGPGKSRHIGPDAEEFYQAFGLGSDGQHLAPSDVAAVALAAVQALKKENTALKENSLELKTRIQFLRNKVDAIEIALRDLKESQEKQENEK